MSSSIIRRGTFYLSRELSPALAVLVFAIFFFLFLDNLASMKTWEVIYTSLFRFLRLTLSLCLPLYILPPIYRFFVNKMKGKIIQTEKTEEILIDPVKHWVFRPFQGIGIGLLFETKLLSALQIITGVATKPFPLFPRSQFDLGRLLIISAIVVIISLLLSILWTLDDVGIRYLNHKDQEIRMIGKYVGTLMPILFGFYGIFSLIADFPMLRVLNYLFRTAIILYPPFTIFAVLHYHFLKNRSVDFYQRTSLRKGGIWVRSD